MFKTHFSQVAILIVFGLLVGCEHGVSTSGQKPPVWRSKYHPVVATLTKGWKKAYLQQPGDTCDTPEKLLMAFFNKEAKAGYVLRIEKDAPLEQLSMRDYIDVLKQQYSEYPMYKLESEDTVTLHGKEFQWLRFRLVGSKGPVCTDCYVYRDGKLSITIQWSFSSPLDGPIKIPDVVKEFKKSIRMFDEAR